jgi:hypothetical protein
MSKEVMKNNTKKKEPIWETRLPNPRLSEPHHQFTREFLEEKYGSLVINYIDESHSKDWLDTINKYNEKFFTQNCEKVQLGLNKKVSLHFFQHFFNWDKTGFQVDNFHGNWLDVPFPNVTHIKHMLDRDDEGTISLPDLCYNWYELFILMDRIMWDSGRVLDIGISGLTLTNDIKLGDNVLIVDVSS